MMGSSPVASWHVDIGYLQDPGMVVSILPQWLYSFLFTLLEIWLSAQGSFNLIVKRACAHRKQALTMCMGFGCNAAGVIACRIIDSPGKDLYILPIICLVMADFLYS